MTRLVRSVRPSKPNCYHAKVFEDHSHWSHSEPRSGDDGRHSVKRIWKVPTREKLMHAKSAHLKPRRSGTLLTSVLADTRQERLETFVKTTQAPNADSPACRLRCRPLPFEPCQATSTNSHPPASDRSLRQDSPSPVAGRQAGKRRLLPCAPSLPPTHRRRERLSCSQFLPLPLSKSNRQNNLRPSETSKAPGRGGEPGKQQQKRPPREIPPSPSS